MKLRIGEGDEFPGNNVMIHYAPASSGIAISPRQVHVPMGYLRLAAIPGTSLIFRGDATHMNTPAAATAAIASEKDQT